MNNSKHTGTKIIKTIIRAAPFVMMGICAILYFAVFKDITPEQIIQYTPENIWLSMLFIIGMFSLKSLTFFFPMMVIVAVCGRIAPSFGIALLINTIGTFCMMNIPYFIGKFAEKEFVDELINKHKRVAKVKQIQMKNETFFVYFLRVINCLPYDVVSMFLGSTNCKWSSYILGSMLGTIPGMILMTITGLALDNPTSFAFIGSISINVAFSIASGIIYLLYLRKHKHQFKDL